MNEENKLFKADKSKVKFTITITSYENCSELSVATPKDQPMPSYNELVGLLEINKASLIAAQTEENKKVHNKEEE